MSSGFPTYVGKEGNELADSEAKRGSALPQSAASLDYVWDVQHSPSTRHR